MDKATAPGSILVVDDTDDIRRLLSIHLKMMGHTITEAHDGREALQLIYSQPFDLILLDIMMPHVSGLAVLEVVKKDPALRHIPIVVISAASDLASVVRCIELGAEDFLPKPYEAAVLYARVKTLLERKRLRDNEQEYLHIIEQERATSERLLLNILPKPIADRLRQERRLIVERLPETTVLFADIVDFTALSTHLAADELIEWLNDIFSTFDELANAYGLEKIKTIGDAYMAAAGLPTPRADHVEAAAAMALAIRDMAVRMTTPLGDPFLIRIGLDTGPVVAGVIGNTKFSYDMWGDTVNTASRMESHGLPNRIQVTPAIYEHLRDRYSFEERGMIAVKGKGEMRTYWLLDQLPTES